MLGKFFGKKSAKPIEQPTADIELLGDVQGNGLNALRTEVAIRLRRFPSVGNAYLSRLKYKNDDTVRICLAIEALAVSENEKQEIASGCSGAFPMDILFLESLPEEMRAKLTDQCKPLFISGMNLFECPLVVGRGSNSDMPAEWIGAIISCFVAAQDYQSALFVAVEVIRSEGYEFKTVHDGKVNLLDSSRWWSGYVMEKWNTYAEHFPSQEAMEAIVATGGYFKGPALGWSHGADT